MLYLVHMIVEIPSTMPAEEAARIRLLKLNLITSTHGQPSLFGR